MRRMLRNPDLVIVAVLAVVVFGPAAWKQVQAEVSEQRARTSRFRQEESFARQPVIELRHGGHAYLIETPRSCEMDARWDCPAPRPPARRVWHSRCR